jgi:leader peptidase (prepilin peptidase) / N-methyltransferase
MTAAYTQSVVALLGAAVGSFLTVVVERLPEGRSLAIPRSSCPGCGTALRFTDNVPLVSWALLRGRCRSCRQVIPLRYPLLELATLATFVAIAAVRGVDLDLLLELPFAAMLIAVAAIDLERRIVPNRIVAPAAVYAAVATAIVQPGDLPAHLIAGAGAFVALLLVALAYPAGMGMGDVKLAGVMGLFLGSSVVPALFVAFLAGSIVGLALIARHGSDGRKMGVPFAPFLAIGGLVGVLAGPELVDLYLEHVAG